MVSLSFNRKNELVCFLSALQKRQGDHLVPCLVLQRAIHLLTKLSKERLLGDQGKDSKEYIEA